MVYLSLRYCIVWYICPSGFGRFHIFMVIVMGWANSADTIELLSISFVLPQASCELHATDLELGFLTAVGFAGKIWQHLFIF